MLPEKNQTKNQTLSDNQKKIQSLCTWRVNTLNHLSTWIRSTKCDILLQRKKTWRKIKKKWKFLVIYPQFSLHLCFQLPLFFLLRNKNTEEEGQKPALNQLLRGRSQTAEQLLLGEHPHRLSLQNPAFPPQNHSSPRSAVVFVCSAQTTNSESFQLFVIGNAMQKIKYVNSSLCLPSILKGWWTIIFLPRDLKELQLQQSLGEQLVQKAAMAKPVRAHE